MHNDRARVNLQLGNLKEFIDDALSYFMFDDDVESSLFDLFLYMDDADFLKVETLLPDMLNDKSNCNLVNRFIASIYFKRKDLLKFTKYLLSLDEDCITFSDYMKITDNFFSIGDYETSLKYVDRASELMPEDEYPLFYKLHILTSDKQYDEVIALCNKRLSEKEIDDNSSFFYKMRAVSKPLKNDYDGAIADFTQALQLCNNWNYGMSQQRADLYMVKGEKELALMDYKRTVEMDLNPEITSCAHYVFMLLGEQEKAFEFFNWYAEVVSDKSRVVYEKACLYVLMGKIDEALVMLRESFDLNHVMLSTFENDFRFISIANRLEVVSLKKEYTRKFNDIIKEQRRMLNLE